MYVPARQRPVIFPFPAIRNSLPDGRLCGKDVCFCRDQTGRSLRQRMSLHPAEDSCTADIARENSLTNPEITAFPAVYILRCEVEIISAAIKVIKIIDIRRSPAPRTFAVRQFIVPDLDVFTSAVRAQAMTSFFHGRCAAMIRPVPYRFSAGERSSSIKLQVIPRENGQVCRFIASKEKGPKPCFS